MISKRQVFRLFLYTISHVKLFSLNYLIVTIFNNENILSDDITIITIIHNQARLKMYVQIRSLLRNNFTII